MSEEVLLGVVNKLGRKCCIANSLLSRILTELVGGFVLIVDASCCKMLEIMMKQSMGLYVTV